MKYSDDCKVYRIRYYNVWFYLFAKTEMDALMERLQKKTGIKVTPHMLRHYFANARRKAGWKLELISQALGHRNIETTMRYLNISDQELMDVSDEFYRKHQSIYEIDKLL